MTTLSARTRSASVWSLLGQLSLNGLRFVSFLVAPFFLKPSDYGVFGYSLILVMLFQLVVETAIPLAIVQSARTDSELFLTGLTANFLFAILSYSSLCLLADPAAHFLGDAAIQHLIPIMGVQVLFGSLYSIPMALMRRDLDFRRLFVVRLFGSIPSVLLTIALAVTGFGYWALVVGWLSGGLAQLICSFSLSRVPTPTRVSRSIFLELMRFSRWVMIDVTANWGWEYSGGFLVGAALGVSALGKFRLADQAIRSLCAAVLDPLSPVVFSALSTLNRDGRDLSAPLKQMNYVFGTISIPLIFLIALIAYPGAAILGPKWSGLATVLVLDGIAWGLNYLIQAVPQYFRAVGRPALVVMIRLPMALVQLLCLAVAVTGGLRAFLFTRIILEIVMVLVFAFVVAHKFKVNLFRQLSRHLATAVINAGFLAIAYLLGKAVSNLGLALHVLTEITSFVSLSFMFSLRDENSYAYHLKHVIRRRFGQSA